MSTSYIPAKIASYNSWMSNFSSLITANPPLYGLTAGDAAAVAAAYLDFGTKYGLSSSKATRTPAAVADTQAARNALTLLVRGYARLVIANNGVSDANKTALGLTIRDLHPSAVPTPNTSPVLGLIGCTPGQISLTYRDQNASIKSRAKPAGVSALELYILYGTAAPSTPEATPFFGLVTRSPFAVTNPSGSDGKSAFIYGRWINGKGLPGPWSAMLETTCV